MTQPPMDAAAVPARPDHNSLLGEAAAVAKTANITPGVAPDGISIAPAITIVGGNRNDLLGPLEGPLGELHTRVSFLADHFASRNGYEAMGHNMLFLLLADCAALATEARAAWDAAWEKTGGVAA